MVELNSLLEQAVEEQAAVVRAAAVEAERELIEVVVELLRADCALVGAEEPTFEQGGDAVDAGHRDVPGVAACLDASSVVDVAGGRERLVAEMTVGRDDASRLDCLLYEGSRLSALVS